MKGQAAACQLAAGSPKGAACRPTGSPAAQPNVGHTRAGWRQAATTHPAQAHFTQRPCNILKHALLARHLHRRGFADIHNGHDLLCPTGVIR